MKLKGNINQIKSKRDNLRTDVEIHLDKIEYITHKKDGRYFQEFDFVQDLATPLIITGDCLALTDNKYLEEGEYEFLVYDKAGEDYKLNKNKYLSVTTVYDFEEDQTILTSVFYSVTVSNEEFNQKQSESNKEKMVKKGKGRKNR